jgi:hypothetical protein
MSKCLVLTFRPGAAELAPADPFSGPVWAIGGGEVCASDSPGHVARLGVTHAVRVGFRGSRLAFPPVPELPYPFCTRLEPTL